MSGFSYDQNGNRYQLRGGKHTCPSCRHHTLQLYICMESGDPINDQVGKCDRHYNCGYDYPPKAYFQEHPEELPPAKDGMRRTFISEPERPVIPINRNYVLQSLIPSASKGFTTFTDNLLRMFPAEEVKRVIDAYYLGRTMFGAIIFWQIDEKGLVREGKAMKYEISGGRDKASWVTGESFWIYSTLVARKELPADTKAQQCMFGQHLLRDATRDTRVFIVESEKNAVFGSLMRPEGAWLAVGSSQEIGKVWKVKNILAGCRSVVFVPDADAINDWSEYVERFHLPNAAVSRFCAGHAGGYDIADYAHYLYWQNPTVFMPKEEEPDLTSESAINIVKDSVLCEKKQILAHMMEANPAIGLLVEKFELELVA